MKGRFITLEGGEGAGKSTLMASMEAQLEQAGHRVLVTREPGGTGLGEGVRNLLLDNGHSRMTAEAELLLIFAARAQHVQEKIQPALAEGRWVLCDRFTDATYAYQGYGRGVDAARIAWLEAWLQGPVRPDLTLLLDVPVSTGLERAGRAAPPDRFESEGEAFLERVRSGYLALAARERGRIRAIDAGRGRDAVAAEVRQILSSYLNNTS